MKHFRPGLIFTLLPVFLATCAAPPASIPVDLSTFKFQFDPDHGTIDDIPRWIRDLDGRDIVMEGYMIPLDQAEQITEFALIYALPFDGPPPGLQETVVCKMPSGKSMVYCSDRLRVYGKLHVALVKEEGFIVTLYTLDIDHVDEMPAPSTLPSTQQALLGWKFNSFLPRPAIFKTPSA